MSSSLVNKDDENLLPLPEFKEEHEIGTERLRA